MKVLIVIHACDAHMLEKQLEDYQTLLRICVSCGMESGTYLYTEREAFPSLNLEHSLVPYSQGEIWVDDNWFWSATILAEHIAEVCKAADYQGVLIMGDSLSNETAGLIAWKWQGFYAANVSDMNRIEQGIQVYRPVYNNNMEAVYTIKKGPFAIGIGSLRQPALPIRIYRKGVNAGYRMITELGGRLPGDQTHIREQRIRKMRESGIKSDILLGAGKGIGSREEVSRLRSYAAQRGFQFGVTRPVAMNGWAKLDEIIGVSGQILAPKFSLIIGASGSAAFYAGIARSRYILSLNPDRKCAMAERADLSITEDYRCVWSQIEEVLNQEERRESSYGTEAGETVINGTGRSGGSLSPG